MNTLTGLLAVTLMLLGGCRIADEDLVPPKPADSPSYGLDMVANGKISYEKYCVSCHGVTARGDGPVAVELITKPSDLTKLSSRYNGVFPTTEVYEYIDGRKSVAAHGTRMMPVWGNIWTERSGEDVVHLRIQEIVDYIETLQDEQQ